MKRKNWLDVDMEGMRKVLERRGKQLAIYELVQNGWDENVTKVEVTLARPENGRSELVVSDDSPEGFRDLTDSYTMFAESYKKADPQKRGAFNIGEKYVLALCDEATITTTTGRVAFDENGRRRTGNVKRERGSEFRGFMRLKLSEWETMSESAMMLIPPVPTFFNGEEISPRTPLREWAVVLATVKGDEEGNLRRTERQTTVRIYGVLPGESPTLYEMGIPVVEIDSKYHVCVGQKVPLNIDRDNVTPAYLKTIYVEILNHTHDLLTKDDASANWVRTGSSDSRVTDEAITSVVEKRFGEKRVIYDPSDPEGTKIAITRDYAVVHGGAMSVEEWENVKRANAILPAGKVTPSPKPFGESGKPLSLVPHENWTHGMRDFVCFAQEFARVVLGHSVQVEFTNQITNWGACYGPSSPLYVSKVRHGGKWFDGTVVERTADWARLLIHEFAHDKVSDHLSSEFHKECCTLGAKYAAHLQRTLSLATAQHEYRGQR
ncbi:MAG: hypothetical protein ABSD53_09725 [Terriglobales bacterium]|jgi:hypothetical protein